ncbi:hypothetical protein ANCCAN_01820 [Ancylostoma caninum]|uniref:Uncharacterized protein n=1 Tax=Ancylostoma caninum TaxID=29170 RepID=A0A368H605_ANCCA|nr:hypothetical protein ANCCAN_01820 [Ancylostoma caninum]
MKLLSMARSLLFRKRSPGNLSMREDSVKNEYADYHQYCSVDYGDYSTVECISANDTLPSQSTAPPPPDNINHLILVNRSDGYLKFKALCGNRVIIDVINTSNYSPFLCGSVVDFAEVTGVITDSFLLWLSAARVVTSLRIRDAKMVCRSTIFYNTMHRIALQSLSICRCFFSDAQILSDELFSRNPQICMFEITSIDGRRQSFPLLTDRTLRGWCATGIPRKLLLHHVETSFTILGVRSLIEAGLRQRHSLSWSFGRICSTTEKSMNELEECKNLYGDQLQILRIHRSYIHVISEVSPKMYVFFYTSVERPLEVDDLE